MCHLDIWRNEEGPNSQLPSPLSSRGSGPGAVLACPQQQVSAPCPPAGLFVQTNHILLWDPGGAIASGYDKACLALVPSETVCGPAGCAVSSPG